jgi:hypothetical protein
MSLERLFAGRSFDIDGNGLPFVRLSESRRVGHSCHVALCGLGPAGPPPEPIQIRRRWSGGSDTL